jgi:triphosphatase
VTSSIDNLKLVFISLYLNQYRGVFVFEFNYKETTVMACFDSGIIKSSDGSRTDEICELELEMISGHVEDLNELADYFISNSGCVPFDRTKYRRTLDIIVGDQNGK